MSGKKIASIALASLFLLPSLTALSGCNRGGEIVLRVYNWEEYIDEGGKGAFIYDELHLEDGEESDIVDDGYRAWYEETMRTPLSEDGPAILDDFCLWYEAEYGQKIRVEYSTFGTNEDMYNEIVLGNEYDLLCPSDYMIMKLAAEGRLERYDDGRDENGEPDGSYDFFDPALPNNYYVRNVSPFIAEKFANNAGLEVRNDENGKPITWQDYAAGYMWGTTGFVYNPNPTDRAGNPILFKDADGETTDLGTLLASIGWEAFTEPQFKGKVTAKDNVRDTYFAALGVKYQEELLTLTQQFAGGSLDKQGYTDKITGIFNATDEKTISEVEPVLMDIKKNIYGWETDTGKADMVKGNVYLNYAWSGDAVYALDLGEDAEDEDGYIELNYYVPEAGSNLWFDGWVMPKGANKQAAQAFVNFLSMPQNAMRNSYYIGYTSVIAGEEQEMLAYADYLYGEEESEDDFYDLSYFFGAETGTVGIYADEAQRTCRQLYAQFPTPDVIERCAVMDYYDEQASVRINELWSRVKAETLDAWAIVVISVSVLAIAAFIVVAKFGGKIDFFRAKPKKGYKLVKQETVR